jgi:hypothetical protein
MFFICDNIKAVVIYIKLNFILKIFMYTSEKSIILYVNELGTIDDSVVHICMLS